jgi:NAD(P)-dependent dehydrogenase (short-subunit alcohol dehydrogenase family)
MSTTYSGRTVVVTGGTSGIGLATTKCFLEAGANVAICGRDEGRLDTALADIKNEYGEEHLFGATCDVLIQEQVDDFANAVVTRFGGVDTLVNNAGQARLSTFANTDDDMWREELDLKFFSIIHPTKGFQAHLEKSNSGAIVCVSSLLSRQPEPRLVATSAARAGQLSLVHSMANELAPAIRVNSILIGVIVSGQWQRRFEADENSGNDMDAWLRKQAVEKGIPLGRFGQPEEAANAIFFLGTPMSSYTTGSTIDLSGGYSRHVG